MYECGMRVNERVYFSEAQVEVEVIRTINRAGGGYNSKS